MQKYTGLIIIIVILFLNNVIPVFSRNPIPLPSEEAADSLFSLGLDDPDVELFITGSWNARFSASWGFGYSPGRGLVSGAAYPGMETGYNFEQHPDLTLSLWLFERYFLETFFSEDWESSTFLLGYQGQEDETLQSAVIGNTGVGMDNYAFLSLSDMPVNGLGAGAQFKTPNSMHEFVLRFDPTEKQKLLYRGSFLVEEEALSPGDYRKGQDFILPDRNAESLTVLLEGADGESGEALGGDDGRIYHTAPTDSYSWDGVRGTISFPEPLSGSVLIFYPGMTVSAPMDTAGLPWADEGMTPSQVTVQGTNYILLFRPGRFSPLEVNRFYPAALDLSLNEPWKTSAYLVPVNNPGDTSFPLVITIPGEGIIALGSGSSPPGTSLYSYPLLGTAAADIYGPERQTAGEEQSASLLIQALTPVTEYRLDNPLPGSVKIRLNGVEESRFSLDDSGVVTFPFFISASDRIEITYRTLSTGDQGGDLLFGMGNRFTPFPGFSLELGTGLRWNILTGTFTEKSDQSAGSLLASAAARWKTDNFSAEIDAGVSLSNPDTTGIFRLRGMEEAGLALTITGTGVYPSGVPDDPLYTLTNRGRLLSRDYHSYNALGTGYLQDYTWTPPDGQIYPYVNGSRTGPYTATAKIDGKGGQVLVLDYELDTQENWVGAQVPWGLGSPPSDLSSCRALNFSWFHEGAVPENLKVVIQMGALGEDLDGDGVLDREASTLSDGFSFDHPEIGVLKYGGGETNKGNGYRETEDFDGDGILDAEDPDIIHSWDLFSGAEEYPGTQWKYVRLPLTPEIREKLTSVSGIRIYLVNEDTTQKKGRLLVGDFFLEGSTFLVTQPAGTSALSAGEAYEGQLPAAEQPLRPLEADFPEVLETFHPSNAPQKLLRAAWDGSDAAGTDDNIWNDAWTIRTYTRPVLLSGYRRLSFYIRIPRLTQAGDNRFTIRFTGPDGRGISASFPPEVYPGWRKLSINYAEKTLSLDGTPVPGAVVEYTPSSLPAAELSLGMTGSSAGLLFADEIHLEESVLETSGGVRGRFEYSKTGEIAVLGEVPLLSDFSLAGQGYYKGSSFASGFADSPAALSFGGSADSRFTILFSELAVSGEAVSSGGEVLYSESHLLRIPQKAKTFSFTDSYGETNSSGGKNFSRSNTLAYSPGPFLDWKLAGGTVFTREESTPSPAGLLNQSWNTGITSRIPLNLGLNLDAALSQSLKGWVPDNEFYLLQWLDAYRYLIPREGETPGDRNGQFSTGLSYTPGSFSLTLSGRGNYASLFSGVGQEQSNDLGLSLKGLVFEKEGEPRKWNLTLEFLRELSWTVENSSGTFLTDWESWMGGIGGYPFYFRSLPVYELYQADLFSVFRDTAEGLPGDTVYAPGAVLSLARTTGSYLADLYLPASLKLQGIRTLSRRGSVWTDELKTGFSARFQAINLFGRRGAYPRLARFYESEEFVTIVTINRKDDLLTGTTGTLELILQNYLYFQRRGQDSLSLDSRLDMDFSGSRDWKETGTFSWIRPSSGEALKKLKLPQKWTKGEEDSPYRMSLENTGTLEFTIGTEDSSDLLGFLLGHRSSLVVPRGRIGVFASAGMKKQETADGDLFLFGVEAGMEANFSY